MESGGVITLISDNGVVKGSAPRTASSGARCVHDLPALRADSNAAGERRRDGAQLQAEEGLARNRHQLGPGEDAQEPRGKIGRASCREREEMWEGDGCVV